ncbi:MAG: AMP-binding protein [Firmicutes bacterium]|nr:AMP-binding protein [Bacillota bacterium]
MATPAIQFEPGAVEAEVRTTLRTLLEELGSPAAETLAQPGTLIAELHLERDLGLGSLERVELLLRLGRTFQTQLPDRILAEAETVGDVVAAVLAQVNGRVEAAEAAAEQAGTEAATELAPSARALPWPVLPARGLRTLRHPEEAETLLEVLWYRGTRPETAAAPHLYLYEEGGPEASSYAARVISNGELLARAAAVALSLQQRRLRAGDRVALMLPTSADFFFCFFGVLLAGGIPVPIYPPFRADRLEEYAARQAAILRNAEVRWLISFDRAARIARLLRPRVPSLEAVLTAAQLTAQTAGATAVAPVRAVRGEDLAFLQYTSGSTGHPKGVMLTHANLLANLRAICETVGLRPDDVGVSWLPLYHDMGLIGTWLLPLYAGIPTVVMSPLAFLTRPARWLWALHHHRGTLTAAPNFAFELCARKVEDRELAGLDLRHVRAALNGAEPVHPETLCRFTERFAPYGWRHEMHLPVYGLAEATLAVTIPLLGRPPLLDSIERDTFQRTGRAVPAADATRASDVQTLVSCGRPIPRHEVRIVDDQGQELPERTEGRLWFRGPSATQGYFRNPSDTRELVRDGGWLDSGDRAYRVGEEIFITGRAKDVIIKAGRNIAPQEIEELVGEVSGVRPGCVVAFGIPDERSGTERLVITAEVRPESLHQRAQLAARISHRVAEALGLPPDHIELLPPQTIPKTSSGKLRRSETRQLYLSGRLVAGRPPVWWQVLRLTLSSAARATLRTARQALVRLYGVYALLMFVFWLLPTWAVMRLLPTRRAVVLFTSRLSRLYFRLVGIPIRRHGFEHLQRHPNSVLVANHTSYFDVLVLMAALPVEFRFVSKIEVASMPLIGDFLRRRGDFAFDRGDRQQRLRQAEEVERSLRAGDCVLVFPEGTFTPHDGVRPFQLGAFKAAVATGRPILPVALRGVREILRDETLLPRPGSVAITILPPIFPEPGADPREHWREIIRLRDQTRTSLAPHTGEPLL